MHRKARCHWTRDAGDETDSKCPVSPHNHVCGFPAEENGGLALEKQSRLRCQLANTYAPVSDFQRLTPHQDNTLEQTETEKRHFYSLDKAAINFGLRDVIPPKFCYSALESHERLVDLCGDAIQNLF